MEPTNNQPMPNMTEDTPPQISQNTQKSPLGMILLTAILCLIIGIASTLAVVYFLEFNFERNNTNQSVTPTDNNYSQVNNKVIEYEMKTLGVEYNIGKGVTNRYKVLAPKSAEITNKDGEKFTDLTLKYSDEKTGKTILTFSIPHYGEPSKYKEYVKIETSLIKDLYRVQTEYQYENTPNIYAYTNQVTLTGTCDDYKKTPAVCGDESIDFENTILIVTATNDKNDYSIADKIVSTLEIVK